jgi:large subunit ribosomal protein L21
MFAVIKTGGRQYRVVPDDVLEIGKIAGDVGTIVQLGEVLLLGGDTPTLGLPTVAGASVAAEVLQHKRGPKVIAFKKRRRKNSRRKRGYRDEITVLRITEILADNAKPSIGPRPKREKVVKPADDGDEAPKKAPVKKPVAKTKAAAKPRAKPDTKKPAAKKAAAKGKSDKK